MKLTVCAGLVVLVGFLLPQTAKAEARLLWWPAVGAIGVFAVCLGRTLWLALRAVDVAVTFPAVEAESFRQLAAHAQPELVEGLRSLVGSYVGAIEANNQIIAKRKAPGDALVWWSAATLIASFVAVGLLLALYVQG